MNATIDSELVKVVHEHVCRLSNEVEKMAFKNEKERNDLKICLEKFQSHLQALEKRVEKVEHEYDTLHQEMASTAVRMDHVERSQEAVEQRITEIESQEKCNVPKTISYGEF